ncbi:MAG: YihY/virulence factor BrkB family protein [Deltaproteobacteria bacterium]|nr:MAG: YihY/virulence factor BrkB family protein [Deltaproteobacteria bacterium]
MIQWFKTLAQNWSAHRCPHYAAAIAFYTIFSLAPMLIVGVTLASWKFEGKKAQQEIVHYVEKSLGKESGAAIKKIASQIGLDQIKFNRNDIWASVLGLLVLLLGASRVISILHEALNDIFGSEEGESSGLQRLLLYLRGQLVSVGLILLFGVLLVGSLMADTLLLSLGKLVETRLGFDADFLLYTDRIISFLLIPLAYALFIKVLPARTIPWRKVWLGTIVSGLLFYAGKSLMSMYLSYSGITSTYGAAGSAIVFLIWINFSIQVLLLGAEICSMSLARERTDS